MASGPSFLVKCISMRDRERGGKGRGGREEKEGRKERREGRGGEGKIDRWPDGGRE